MIVDNKNFTAYILELQKNFGIPNSNLICTYIQEIDKNIYNLFFDSTSGQKDFFFWNLPTRNFSFISFGNVFSYSYENEFNDFININLKSSAQLKHVYNLTYIDFNKLPLFIGGIKFPLKPKSKLWKDFPIEIWYIPEISAIKLNNKYYIALNFMHHKIEDTLFENFENKINEILHKSKNIYFNQSKNNGNINSFYEHDKNNWHNIVSKALKKISEKEIEKVVLARIKKIELKKNVLLTEILIRLEKEYPECYIFAWKKNESIFIAATPEMLTKIENNFLETDALAGSIKRGKTTEEDEKLAAQLLCDKKNINEHNAVLNYILSNLSDISEEIIYDKKPSIKKLRNIQHLWTPIKVKLKNNFTINSIIKKIYPTPAICGLPKEAALQLIDELETFDRGLYAGVIGWFNLEGNAEYAVGIRSALIHKSSLFAFAGCGIVEGSNIENEFDETELKFKPILSLFDISNRLENENIS